MGNTLHKENYNTTYDGHTISPNATTISCKNTNPNYFKDGKFALACPEATDINGECSCGNRCVKDYDSNVCCQQLELIRDKKGKIVRTNCIEDITDTRKIVRIEPRTGVLDPYEGGRYDETKQIINPSNPYTLNDNPFIGATRGFPTRPTPTQKPKIVTYKGTTNEINTNNCNMADIRYNGVYISGQQLCDWYKSPTLKK